MLVILDAGSPLISSPHHVIPVPGYSMRDGRAMAKG
jgi:hypothetical protein